MLMTNFDILIVENSIWCKQGMMKFLGEDIAINQKVKEKTNNLNTAFIADCIIKTEADYISYLAEEIKKGRELLCKR